MQNSPPCYIKKAKTNRRHSDAGCTTEESPPGDGEN